jgi:hypothetical protein
MSAGELANLLKEYRKHSSESDKGKQVKTQLIEKLSSSYWWTSQYIINIFPEDIWQIQENLQQEIENKFQLTINKNHSLKQLAELLLQEALGIQKKYQKELITDRFINTLAIKAKRTNANSFQRKQAVQCLIKAMNIKNTYKKQGLGAKLDLSAQDYEDAFQEAKGESIRYVIDNIDRYDETKGDFMGLINYWIPIKFPDVAGRIIGSKKSQINKLEDEKIVIYPEYQNSELMTRNLDRKAEIAAKEFACHQKSEEIKSIIQDDPNNKLAKPIRKNRTDITFKDVLIAINWEGETFKNLSNKWDIPYTTIKSFYEREFNKVKADLVDYLQ